MKGRKSINRGMALLLALMLVLLAACSGSGGNGAAGGQPSETKKNNADTGGAKAESNGTEPVTLKVLFNSTGDEFENTEVFNEIVKRTGVTMDIELFDEQKFQVQLAGGDLPDIIQVKHINTTYLQQLIEGGHILPLDDLVKSNGPDVSRPEFAESLNYSKAFWSNDTGKLYMVPVQVGVSGWGYEQTNGFVVRWDYYKELGYPEVKNLDDMVNVLADMVALHPTTADGKKVYGTAIWNDWGTWGLSSMGLITGGENYIMPDGKNYNKYTDPAHSGIWDTAYFLYRAQQKGILDPDAFTAKYDDIVAKATQGTLLNTAATWPFANANAELLKEGPDKGFVVLPLDWGFAWAGGKSVAGWADRGFAITKNSKHPERAMDLINFIVSEEGSRLIASGIEGVHWDMVNGKPQMKPEVVKLASEGGEAWNRTGIAGGGSGTGAANQQGLSNDTVLRDGGLVNLFNQSDVMATKLSSLHKDYVEHYGVSYPAEAYIKHEEAGRVKTVKDLPNDISNAMPGMPEDIKRMYDKLEEMVIKGIPEIVLKAKDDADYKARQQQLIDELKAAGADKWFDWYDKAFQEVKALF